MGKAEVIFIVHRFEVTPAQRRGLAKLMKKRGMATREDVRAFIERHGRRGLEALDAGKRKGA